MVRNKETYDKAVEFRKRGFTYSEIAKICDISVSTVSNWLSKKAFSKRVAKENASRAARDNKKRMQLLNKTRKSERTAHYAEAVRTAEIEFKHYKNNPLFVAGLMLYVGEGDNKDRRLIRIANARMDVHEIFIKFAIDYLGVAKNQIRFWILLYPDLNEAKCVKKWSKAINIPAQQFYKNQVIPGKSKKRTLHNGVGNTIIGNTLLKYKLYRWIELSTEELKK